MNKSIPITLTTTVHGEIAPRDLGRTLIALAAEIAQVKDDAGCDWCTLGNDTFIANDPKWHVSAHPGVAALVNAGNYLIYGSVNTLEELPF